MSRPSLVQEAPEINDFLFEVMKGMKASDANARVLVDCLNLGLVADWRYSPNENLNLTSRAWLVISGVEPLRP